MTDTVVTDTVNFNRLRDCYRTVREHLLNQRNAAGHWTGELSTSALSTATAVMALEQVRRHHANSPRATDHLPLIRDGLAWLAAHQNADGGWGDTVKSVSNISTTMLARAVFRATGTEDQYRAVVSQAQAYIDRIGGVPAVIARYGKDKTFSVPILTHCALAGLVDWRTIPALPFELACLPAKFYKTVRLPVVSYALPALIAIGQVRHHHVRSWNPWSWTVRKAAKRASLRVLERIQPENGGFLEAAPLTSFVTMSLAGMGLADHPVAVKGIEFLVASVREDGSWPIDTNLATWVTTLAVNALGDDLPEDAREPIREWLLGQQYKTVHPYTNADPGGWAWTDLPGGVPDADDTPGAMLALLSLASGGHPASVYSGPSSQYSVPGEQTELPPICWEDLIGDALLNGAHWLRRIQNLDGGFPTFCRGWGTLPFDRSSADITAHCLRAIVRACATTEFDVKPDLFGFHAGFRFLKKSQRPDGSWLPLWFGNQHAPDDVNPTYGTARVLAAYRDAQQMQSPSACRGVNWLVNNQNADGGWGGLKGIVSSVEETALATEILLSVPEEVTAANRGVNWLLDHVEDGTWTEPTPIGFYFAKLWYFEALYPQIFLTAALRRAVQLQKTRPSGVRLPEPSTSVLSGRTPHEL